MDFEKAYQKFLDGTATEEEVEFVRAEMNKAKALNDIIDSAKQEGVIDKAEKEEVKKAVKSFNLKNTIKTFIITLSSLVVLAGITLAAIFIPAVNYAKDNLRYTQKDAKEIAVQWVKEHNPQGVDDNKVKIVEFEREFEMEGRLKNAHYVYVMEVYDGESKVYDIEVDSRTGNIIVEDD